MATAILDPSEFKYELMVDIFNNQNIVDAINSDHPGFVPGQNDTLVFKHIFPFLRIPETQSVARTYVLMAVDYTNINRHNQAFLDVKVTLWAMAHHSLMGFRTPGGRPATRIDYISQELRKTFEGKLKFGLCLLAVQNTIKVKHHRPLIQ